MNYFLTLITYKNANINFENLGKAIDFISFSKNADKTIWSTKCHF